MPGRIIPLVNDEIYHVFNRGIDHRITFSNQIEYKRAILAISYYCFLSPATKLSIFLTKNKEIRELLTNQIYKEDQKLVDILVYTLMPNHFHLLLRQRKDNGISKFLSNFQNSYTRYFNTKHKRKGPLFLDQFKAVRIETNDQLLHVSRYIHLNPYSSFVVKRIEDIVKYKWSSLSEYLNSYSEEMCERETIKSFFKNESSHKKFLFDRADYQRRLESIKHLVSQD